MPVDMRIRRAAGYILWKMARGETMTAALAGASAREPGLDEDELLLAVEYAEAAQRFKEIANVAMGRIERVTDPETGRISYRDVEGAEPLTIQDLIDAAGLGPFEHRRNG